MTASDLIFTIYGIYIYWIIENKCLHAMLPGVSSLIVMGIARPAILDWPASKTTIFGGSLLTTNFRSDPTSCQQVIITSKQSHNAGFDNNFCYVVTMKQVQIFIVLDLLLAICCQISGWVPCICYSKIVSNIPGFRYRKLILT